MKPAALVVAVALAQAACTTPPSGVGCQPGERRMVSDTLMIGTAMPGGSVSSHEWRDFLGDTVTPRFPQGMSWWPAQGQWQGARGELVREPSYVLLILHSGSPIEVRSVTEIASAYKARFAQEAVLRTRATACVSF